jgi:hypothetical protein
MVAAGHASIRALAAARWAPAVAATALAAVLQVVWVELLATSGGDLAAQDAWAAFVHHHPGSAYDLAWYGGIHPMSYSVLAPYVMALLGVRTTMVVASTLATGVLTWLVTRTTTRLGPSAYVVAVAGAVAFFGDAVSGRATFALGTLMALVALSIVVARPGPPADTGARRVVRVTAASALAASATACSPVAGLFLGLAATAIWLRGDRPGACRLGLPPVAVVALSAALFPFSGREPMAWSSAVLPVLMGLAVVLLAPRTWALLRSGAALYTAAVVLAWLVPSPIGTNIVRLGLLFGGVALVASASFGPWRTSIVARAAGPHAARLLLAAAIATSAVWQVALSTVDALHAQSPPSWLADATPLVHELGRLHADTGRVEVVPTRSHRESTLLAAHVALARGWNRQEDAGRNGLFYGSRALTPQAYRAWLDRWAVRYVVLSTADPDTGAVAEARLVSHGLPYLSRVWSNAAWSLYVVRDPTPLVSAPATVRGFDAGELVLSVPAPGAYQVRVEDSPWLSLVDAAGHPLRLPRTGDVPGPCLSSSRADQPDRGTGAAPDDWVTLHVVAAGTYRIAAPYKIPRGSPCPS